MFHAKYTIAGCILWPLFLKMAKTWPFYGQNMVLTWSFKLVILNLNQYAKGGSMPNFTILGVSHSPLILKWPKYGHFMAKTWS